MSGLDNTSQTVRTTAATAVTMTANDYVVIFTSASAKTATLPSAALSIPGRIYAMVNTAANAITVSAATGTVDGGATQTIAAGATGAYLTRTFINDGTNWFSLNNN